MKNILYTCFRCNYQSKDKYNINRHFNRNKKCSAISEENDIELTDEIKQKILENKVYYLPKQNTKNIEQKNIIKLPDNDYLHYIYLIRCKENVRHNENVYKIGKTVTKELTINLKRLTGYGIGTELLLIRRCKNSSYIENTILKEFNNKFNRYELGREYFIGDYNDMIEIIHNIISKEHREYTEFLKFTENKKKEENNNEENANIEEII